MALKKGNMRIIFMGSPDFAVPSLDILIQNGYNVVAVITATDKLGGRGGKKVLKTAVKKYAEEANLPILQPKNLKAPEFIEELKSYKADLQIVVAFRMLPIVVWDMPQYGTYNLHGSLLPKYRGAAPIHWAVINGEKETGVTSFKLKHAIDTGDFMFQEKLPIAHDETTGDVYEKLKILGATVILKTVAAIEKNEIILLPQDESMVSKAPKLFHETCEIKWDKKVIEIYNFIRGLSPFPTAWTMLDDLQFNIMEATYEQSTHDKKCGEIVFLKREMRIFAKDGFIKPTRVQLQGKRKMEIGDFLNGYK